MRHDDVSSGHFDWLVEGRSRNQRSTLALYKMIEAHEIVLSRNIIDQNTAQDLVEVAFSLWRAVFLSDLSGDFGNQLADVKKFLQSLIAHNTILYQTDFSTREWTFEYYLGNALFRLEKLSDEKLAIVLGPAKDRWTQARDALDVAIANFGDVIIDQAT